ncbi:MAG TPA: AMP-binding protein [Archangium sp.]|uniref:AMP-binding protein n=1 Tax=Archangium sp. TaxID=1872627 RepID=UPI002E35B85D|nr:AMP-binding protein [Archangium sp.]HEX5747350.1 AMP-binding protein [Archangium sp.]
MAELMKLVECLGDHPATRITTWGRMGLVSHSFAQLQQDVREKVGWLRRRGLGECMRVGVLAANSYEWLVLDLALVSLRCEIVTLTAAQLEGDLERFAAEQELAVLFFLGHATPVSRSVHLGWVVAADSREPIPLRGGGAPGAGRGWTTPFRVFSSGSTGTPRCISVPRSGLEQVIDELRDTYSFDSSDTVLMFLPVSNLQQRFLVYSALWYGISFVLVEPVHLLPALKRTRPTVLLAPPLFFETIARRVTRSAPLRWLMRVMARLPPGSALAGARRRVLAPLRRGVLAELGGQMRLMITGMAPVARTTLELYAALELPLFEAYGMTECGIIACNTPRATRSGSVGRPAPGVRIELASDGEIIVHRDVPLTAGYASLGPEANAETYLGGGRIATGDLGRFDGDGFLYLLGRKKNVLVLGDGRKLHPELIERELMGLPFIHQVALLPEGKTGLACAVHLSEEGRGSEETARRELARLVRELAGQELTRVVFSGEPFTPGNGLLTQNLKLNRRALRELLSPRGRTSERKGEEAQHVHVSRG